MNKVFVFLGPSLSLQQAKNILPDAYFLPPARCGDILRIMRLEPSIIAIIDGYFENTAAVWHKEILYAMEKSVIVLGASSMGALRAGEMHEQGMIGVGAIANAYINNILNNDDAVAVLHANANSEYQAVTEPLVNITATLTTALDTNIIDQQTYQIIYQATQQLFYQERTLTKALTSVKEKINPAHYAALSNWLQIHNSIDTKKNDAILLLQSIANNNYDNFINNNNSVINTQTAFFRSLQKNISCRPFSNYYHWLPIHEKVALFSRYLGSSYQLARRLAYLLSACYQLAITENISSNLEQQLPELYDENTFGLPACSDSQQWFSDNDCTSTKQKDFLLRLLAIHNLILKKQSEDASNTKVEHYFSIMQYLSSDYTKYKNNLKLFSNNEPKKYNIYRCIAFCWWLIECYAEKLNLNPQMAILQETSDSFRIQRNLLTKEALKQWLEDHDLDIESYQHMIKAIARFNFLILQNNLDALGIINKDENIWWLLDALWLSDIYHDAKLLLNNPDKVADIIEQNKQKPDLEQYAYSLDFITGEAGYLTDFKI